MADDDLSPVDVSILGDPPPPATDEPLAGVQAKLRRADEHLKSLARRWTAFQESDPARIGHSYNLETRAWDSFFVVDKQIPIELSTITSDALVNLRACLNHLVGCFVEHFGGAIEPNHAFPIMMREKDYVRRVELARRVTDRGGPLRGIPIDTLEWVLIRDSQPYMWGDAADKHPIAVLQKLVNIDKHRHLHASATYFDVASALDLLAWEPDAELVDSSSHWSPGQPLEHGTRIATLRFSRERPARELKANNPVGASIAFGSDDPEEDRGDLRDVYEYVHQIVEAASALSESW